MKKVTIIGKGWVGKAMYELFPHSYIYTHKIGTKEEVRKSDIVFVCVPTPVINKGKLDTSIVEDCMSWIGTRPLIVVRSTVNPGDCDKWEHKYKCRIIMQPEYLGETPSHPMLDPKTRPFLIIGGSKDNRQELIELYQTVYNANISIRQVSNLEAEIIKLSENRAIAFKVAQCQELYDICNKCEVDYYTIRDAVYGDDPRFNLWWTFVFPDKRGFNSKCIPKDVYAFSAWAEKLNYNPKITKAILDKNEEWINNKG